jgi:hypothetical protein
MRDDTLASRPIQRQREIVEFRIDLPHGLFELTLSLPSLINIGSQRVTFCASGHELTSRRVECPLELRDGAIQSALCRCERALQRLALDFELADPFLQRVQRGMVIAAFLRELRLLVQRRGTLLICPLFGLAQRRLGCCQLVDERIR